MYCLAHDYEETQWKSSTKVKRPLMSVALSRKHDDTHFLTPISLNSLFTDNFTCACRRVTFKNKTKKHFHIKIIIVCLQSVRRAELLYRLTMFFFSLFKSATITAISKSSESQKMPSKLISTVILCQWIKTHLWS